MTQKFTGNVKPDPTWLTFPAVYVYLIFLPYCLIVYIDIAAVCIDIVLSSTSLPFYFVKSSITSLLLCTKAVISSGFSGLCASIARSYNCLQIIEIFSFSLLSTTNCTNG